MAAGTEKLPDIFRLRNKAREDLERVLNAVKSIRDLSKFQPTARRNRIFLVLLGSNPQFLEHFSVNLARSAKIDNSSVQSGEQSDFSHKIIKSNV